MNPKLFIVSNRLPVVINQQGENLEIQQGSGGLVSAISSYIDSTKVNGQSSFSDIVWVGVPGCTQDEWGEVKSTMQQSYYNYLPCFIPAQLYDEYYEGFSNSLLWPLFHYFPTYAEFNTTHFYTYLEVNKLFCEELRKSVSPGDTVWIHDYHLLPLAGMLREAVPGISIGFFLHIPFPDFEIFRFIPRQWQTALLKGMLGADLIGFHTMDYASHFLHCVQMVLGIDNENNLLRYQNRLLKVDVFPIGIDYHKFNNAWDLPEVAQLRQGYHQRFAGKKIIFSVDRLDYTKGILNRLQAYEYFLDTYPEYIEKVVFVLVIVPSRDTMTKYAEGKRMIDEFTGYLNSRFGNVNWQPVIYQYNSLNLDELISFYTGCHLALITPLRDGMNLVAKEFVASRKDKQGVLVLSELAGAARELSDALIINPNDTAEIATAMKMGLEMPESEQAHRLANMQQRIEEYNVTAWAQDFMEQLAIIKDKQHEIQVKMLHDTEQQQLLKRYSKSKKRLLLFDYDGTMVPIAPEPELAAPTEKLLRIINELAADARNEIYIISGRPRASLENWFKELNVNLVSEHGANMRLKDGEWHEKDVLDTGWQDVIVSIMKKYVQRCANTFVEVKNFSLAWHYRNADTLQGKLRAAELMSELLVYIDNLDLQILKGKKVVEVRRKNINKGSAVEHILQWFNPDFILSCGDDVTDEDMFKILANNKAAFTIKVGMEPSYAGYNIPGPAELLNLLETMLGAGVTAGSAASAPGAEK